MDGMVVQQSWLRSAPCEAHGIVSQHCIASSDVAIGEQSTA